MLANVNNVSASTSTLIPRAVLRAALDSNNLNISHINVQSLIARRFSKFNELKMNIFDCNLDIICMTETWLDDSINNRMVSVDGYKIFRNDRNRHGGGVCIYVREGLVCRVLDASVNDGGNARSTEFLCCEIKSGNDRFMLAVYYNPPDVDCSNTLLQHFDEFTVNYESTFFIGDFNTDLFKCNNRQIRLRDVISGMAYVCINSEPTFFHQTGCSLLDLCLTDSPDKVLKHDQISLPGVSNHDMVFVSLKIGSPKDKSSVYYRDYSNFDSLALQNAFNCIDWNAYFLRDDPDFLLEYLNDKLRFLHDTYIPLRISRPKKNPWFTSEIEQAIISRNIAYKNWLRDKTVDNNLQYKRIRNRVTCLIRNSKINYEKRTVNVNVSSKQLWNNIKKLGVSKDKTPGNNCSATSNEINNYFSSNFISDNQPMHTYSTNADGFVFHEIENFEIVNAVFDIKSNAVGLDNISIKFIKIILPLAISHFNHLFNSIITTTRFPAKWKQVKVIPIKKKERNSDITNLRPISLLCSLSKVLEKLLKNQMCEYINRMSFLTQYQSGFRRKHSTTTALLKVHDDIARSIDKKGIAILLLIDFAKAFDRVSHRKLLDKLSSKFYFSNTAVSLIKSYLSERTQTVFHNMEFSTFIEIKSGVPQGSILGPLLFSLFINDLPSVLEYCSVHLFADDVQIYLCSDININMYEISRKINSDLQKLLEWSRRNLLMINPSKTKALLINKTRSSLQPPDLYFDNEKLQFVDQALNLGMIFTSNLCWDAQINQQCRKIYYGLKQLNLTTRHLDTHTKIRLFKTLLFPHFIFCDFIYSNASMAAMNKMRLALNACVRYVHRLPKFSRVSHLHETLLGCSFMQFFEYRLCLNLYKIIKSRTPHYLFIKITRMRQPRTMNLSIPHHNSAYYGNSFFVRSIVLWNALPVNVKLSSSIIGFKRDLLHRFSNMN